MNWIHHNKPWLGVPLNSAHPFAKGLVGLWLMNEGSGNIVQDLSRNGNIGTLSAGTNFDVGKFGSALSFGGAASGDYVSIGAGSSLGMNNLTIIAWVKPTDATGLEGIITRGINSTTSIIYYLGLSSNDLNLIVSNSGSSQNVSVSLNKIVGNVWQQVVATVDDLSFIGYVNGIKDLTVGRTVGPLGDGITATTGLIGELGTADRRPFNGLIDHVMIYNRALSASEIAQLYRNPFAMFERDPVELWVTGAPPAANVPTAHLAGPLWGPLSGPVF
ncbi:hypothetical protein LCGC14_0434360 [marine sediment metagenome]|uniref:LamG-like jellyroll fold domain-containing protein n=1 Tax=marine sediment metagenome TaxID=412755 RepID=A0A0F9V959_9ZZZZ